LLSAGKTQAEPLGPASDYNVFILGDDNQSNTDARGRVAVGGTANFSSYSVAVDLPTNTPNALVVGGDVNFTNGTVNGQLHYGGSSNVSNATITGGAPIHDQPIDFTAAANSLSSLSSSLSQLTANGTVTDNYGLTLKGTDANLDVFNLTTTQLSQANHYNLNIVVPVGATVLINVDGSTGANLGLESFAMKLNGSDMSNSDGSKVLLNLSSNVTSLNMNSLAFFGSILAPETNITASNGNINGTLIGASLNGTIEAHNVTFTGNLPAVAVPEPSSVALLGLSALGCGVLIRRQGRRAA